VPTNYILLLIFTLCQAFYFSVVTTLYTANSVLAAAGMTSVMTVALTIYACTTKTDFTACGALFFCIFIGVILLSIISMFMSFVAWWHPFMSAIMVIIYGLYVIYDTQLIAGGGQHELSMDDYVIGAMILYVDIMMMFLELLRLFGDRD